MMYVPGPADSKIFPGMFDAFLGHAPTPPPTPAEIEDWLAKAKAAADSADIIIAVVGEPALMSGENASRGTLDLPGIQELMVDEIMAAVEPGDEVMGWECESMMPAATVSL